MPTVTGDNFFIDKHNLQFRTGVESLASISYAKTSESISINNEGTGSINIGDAGGDIYIGDGSTQTDIIFEQNGAIRALSNKTLNLGQSDSNVQVNAQNLIVSGDADFSGAVAFNNMPTISGNSFITGFAEGDTLATVTARGATTSSDLTLNGDITVASSKYIGIGSTLAAIQFGDGSVGNETADISIVTNSDGEITFTRGGNAAIIGADFNIYKDTTIEKTTPILKLDGTSNAEVIIDGGSSSESLIRFKDNGAESWILRQTNSDNQLAFRRSSTDYVVLDNAGNVGIGTTNPQKNLDIQGQFMVRPTSNTTVGRILFASTSSHSHIEIKNASSTNKVFLNSNGDSYFDGGSLGVGMSAPTARLELKAGTSDSSANAFIAKNSSSTSLFSIRNDGRVDIPVGPVNIGNNLYLDNNEIWAQNSNNLNVKAAGDVKIQPNDGATTAATFKSDGKVGIGTNSPVAKLEVQTDSLHQITSGLLIHNNVSTTGTAENGVGITMGRAGGVYASKIANVWTNNNPSYLQTNIAFYTMHDSHLAGSETEKMRLTSQGRLGIGVTNPSERLEVNPDNDSSAVIGKAHVGYIGHSNWAGFSHVNTNNTTQYALLQNSNGQTLINKKNATSISFRSNNVEIAKFGANNEFIVDTDTLFVDASTDRVGIGKTSADTELDVNGVTTSLGFKTNTANTTSNLLSRDSAGNSVLYVQHAGNGTNQPIAIFSYGSASANAGQQVLKVGKDISYFNNTNLGIGATNPAVELDVVGTGDFDSVRILNSNSTLNPRLILGRSNTENIQFHVIDNDCTITADQDSDSNQDHKFILNRTFAGAGENDFQIAKDGTAQVTVDTDGNVGIGTTSPQAKLHVNGDIRTNNDGIEFTDTNAYIRRTSNDLEIRTFAGYSINLLPSSNVGIGTASPAYKLDVIDSDGGTLARFKDSDSSHNGIIIQGDTNGGSITNNTAFTSEVIYLQNSANAMRFYTDGTEAVRIDSSQRVGIGTNSVNGFTHINGRMLVESPTVPSTLAISDSGDASKNLRLGYEPTWDVGCISASDFGAGWKDIVIAPHAGKVGIGTSAPAKLLDIDGDTRVKNAELQITSSAAFTTHLNYLDGGNNYISQANGGATFFRNNGGTLMFLNSAGDFGVDSDTLYVDASTDRVGINTNSPGAALDLRGDMRLDSAGNTDRSIYFRNQNSIAKIRSDASLQFDVGVSASPSAAMYIEEDTRNVGILNTDPQSRLDVRLGDGTSAEMNSTGVNNLLTLRVGNNEDPANVANAGAKWGMKLRGFINDNSNPNRKTAAVYAVSEDVGAGYNRRVGMALHTSPFDADHVERVRIDAEGLVGIGTADPQSRLHVYGDAVNNASNADYGIAAFENVNREGLSIGYDANDNYTYLYSREVGVASRSLRLNGSIYVKNYDGNVGIGTTNPSKKLEVDGDVAVYDSLQFFDNSSTPSVSAFIHRPASNELALGTNSNERIRIDTAGSVGIGTNNPSAKLHAEGSMIVKGDTSWAGADNNHGAIYLNTNARGILGAFSTSYARNLIEARNNYIQLGNENTSLIYGFKFYAGSATSSVGTYDFFTSGTNSRLHIAKGGNVGIGTATPAALLHVYDSAGPTIRFERGAASKLDFEFGSTNTSLAAAGEIQFRANGGTTNKFVINNSLITSNADLYVNADVGIGTNNPEADLSIVNTAGIVGMNLKAAADNICYIDFGDSSDNNIGGINYSNINDTLNFRAGNANRVTITSAGEVGIGTTDPDTLLEVAGVIKSSSTSRVQADTYNNSANSANIIYRSSSKTIVGNNADALVILDDGKVGIGTTNPEQELHVYQGNTKLESVNGSDVSLQLGRSDNANLWNFNHAGADLRIFNNGGNGYDILFGVNGGGSTLNNKVGIGTAVPSQALDIVGYLSMANTRSNNTQKIARQLVPEYNNSHGAFLAFMGTSNVSSNVISYGGGTSSADAATEMRFYTASSVNTTIGTERMRISNGGNVGIGVTNPSYTLQVGGSIVGSSKSFLIKHPTKEGKQLLHACIEGPENGVYFRGKSTSSILEMPDYWIGLVHIDSMTVDITAIGPNQDLYVESIAENGEITVGSNTDEPLNYFYVVYGERKDIDKLEIEITKP